MSELVLTALRAENPMAVMAALGLLRLCDGAAEFGRCRLSWREAGRIWRPVLHVEEECAAEGLCVWLEDIALRGGLPWRHDIPWDKVKGLEAGEFRRVAEAQPAVMRSWLAGFTAEPLPGVKDSNQSPFDTMAGQVEFLAKLREAEDRLRAKGGGREGEPEQWARALFEGWAYEDEVKLLNWDPATVAQGAFAVNEPKSTPANNELAAFWLAGHALPYYAVVWTAKGTQAVGWTLDAEQMRVPLWTTPLTTAAIRRLMQTPSRQAGRECAARVTYRRYKSARDYRALSFGVIGRP